ncbi:MAG: D-alanyl-D-alanine carboxypeptidase [Ruminococcus sp.]|nr:D-alanyl-D-alanine carboxypeptidase [Ruminococcus sp.]
MKRLCCALASLCLMLCVSVLPASAEDVSVSAQAYVLYCPQNEEIILSENKDARLPMASTTKVMTALLTLEEAQKDNCAVEFTEEMTAEGSSMYLEVGEQVTLYDLAVGMLMQSGNDAANAAAIAIDGSLQSFADRMNIKASELGMKNTHFVTPSGLDDEDHYSTAYDMALLLSAAMENDAFREITENTSMTVDFVCPDDKRVTYQNHNKLLKFYEPCIGGKTGYTERAGRCLVTCAEKDGVRLICVTLDDPDDWDDHIALFEEGFSRVKASTLGEGETFSVPLVGAAADAVTLICEPQTAVLPADAQVERKVILPDFVYAPVKRGETLGEIRYLSDGKEILKLPLVADEDIDGTKQKTLLDYIKGIFYWL